MKKILFILLLSTSFLVKAQVLPCSYATMTTSATSAPKYITIWEGGCVPGGSRKSDPVSFLQSYSTTIANISVAASNSVTITGAGINVATHSGTSFTITAIENQTLSISGSVITISGTGSSVTVPSYISDKTVTISNGTGISSSGTYPNFTITNTAPDQTVSFSSVGNNTVTGTYPIFVLTTPSNLSQFTNGPGYITGNQSISLTGVVTGSGTTTIATSIPTGSITGAMIHNADIDLTTKVTNTLPVGNGGSGTSTSFTQGSILFAGASGIYSQDNANHFWDATNKRLGIGTTAPSSSLEVSGNGTNQNIRLTRYSTDANMSGFVGRKARGTSVSPTQIFADDAIGLFGGEGYSGAGFSIPQATIKMFAAETWTATATGTYMTFNTTPIGSTTNTEAIRIYPNGAVVLSSTLTAINFSGRSSGTNLGDQTVSLNNYTLAISNGNNINLPVEYAVTAGGVDTYTANLSPAISAYTTGLKVFVIFTSANTGACTINYNSVGARSIKKFVSSALISGDIVAGQAYTMIYDGTNFQMLQPGTAQGFILKIRTGDQAVTTNTMTSITDLVYPVLANSVYTIQGVLSISCNNTGGVKFTTTIPTSATMKLNYTGNTSSATVFLGDFLLTSSTVSGAFCTQNASRSIIVSGTVTTGASAGNIQFQMQSTTNLQISTVFQEGTFLRIQKTD